MRRSGPAVAAWVPTPRRLEIGSSSRESQHQRLSVSGRPHTLRDVHGATSAGPAPRPAIHARHPPCRARPSADRVPGRAPGGARTHDCPSVPVRALRDVDGAKPAKLAPCPVTHVRHPSCRTRPSAERTPGRAPGASPRAERPGPICSTRVTTSGDEAWPHRTWLDHSHPPAAGGVRLGLHIPLPRVRQGHCVAARGDRGTRSGSFAPFHVKHQLTRRSHRAPTAGDQ